MLIEPEDVRRGLEPPLIHELRERLAAKPINVETILRDKTDKSCQSPRGALRICANELSRAAHGLRDRRLGAANWAGARRSELPDLARHTHDFRNNLIRLNDDEFRPFVAHPEPFALGNIAEIGATDACPFQSHRRKHSDRRNRAHRATPLNMVERGCSLLILPLKGEPRPRRVVSRHGTRLRIGGIIINDDKPIHGVRVLPPDDTRRPTRDFRFQIRNCRTLNLLAIDYAKPDGL